jgi:hypothetical protein
LTENLSFIDVHKIGAKAFTRKRTWDFKATFLFLCNHLNKRAQSEIDSYFSKLLNTPEERRETTSSSFSQARDKIGFEAFEEALSRLNAFYYEDFFFKTFHSWRLIAIDGSVYTLTRNADTIKEFGDNSLSSGRTWVKAKVSFASDVLNNICVDADIKAYKTGERSMAVEHLKKLGTGNLYLLDRGYFGREFLAQVHQTKCQYCFRVSVNACKEVSDFVKGDLRDIIADIATEDGKITVRLTKVKLNANEEEYLLTSLLDTKVFTPSKLKKLYHKRWGVEEQFKDMKHALLIENFLGKKPNSIKQEFFGNIISYNLAMMVYKPLIDKASNKAKRKNKKHKYKANKRAIISKFKQSFVRLMFPGKEPLEHIIANIVISLSKEAVPIRNGRHFERKRTYKIKRKTVMSCAPVV